MILEVVGAVLLALAVLWLVGKPFLGPARRADRYEEPAPIEETARGQALIALKELEFDYATGKVADADYQAVKPELVAKAARLLDAAPASAGAASPAEALIAARRYDLGAGGEALQRCPRCGPRPEADARFCSSCGLVLVTDQRCGGCGSGLEAGARFCVQCGQAA